MDFVSYNAYLMSLFILGWDVNEYNFVVEPSFIKISRDQITKYFTFSFARVENGLGFGYNYVNRSKRHYHRNFNHR